MKPGLSPLGIQKQQKSISFFVFSIPSLFAIFQCAAKSVGTQFSLPHDTLPLVSAWSLPSPLLRQHWRVSKPPASVLLS